MTKILILHASLGTGHISAANSIKAAFERRGYSQVVVADVFDFGNRLFEEAVTQSYKQLSEKAPQLWKIMYESTDITNLRETQVSNRVRAEFQRPILSKLDGYVKDMNPDVIIGTHFMPVEVMLAERARGEINQPVYCVITDYMTHSNWIHKGVEGYFVASDLTKAAMVRFGVPADTVHVTGIPIRPEIADPKDMNAMRVKHRLPVGVPLVSLFGGGLNPERVRHIVERLTQSETTDGMLVVVAGRSEKLIDALKDVSGGPRMQLLKLGRIDYVDDLVAASDLAITKSGGLIVSEILARGTPMIIIDPIPGQEEWNADFVSASGAGMQLRMAEVAPSAALGLLADGERLAGMRRRAALVGRPNAAVDIVNQVLAGLAKR